MQRLDLHYVDASPLPYLISVPEAPEPRPLLCFLHGYDEGAPMEIHKALTRHGPLSPNSPALVAREFLVVAPQLPQRGDIWYQYAASVQALLAELEQRFGADPRRRYLTGFSFGGNGVFDLALRQPDVWAALWSVDPTRVPNTDPGPPAWLSVGEAARPLSGGFTQRLGLEAPDLMLAGDRIILDQGVDHVGSARLAYGDRRIYEWLLARAL